jgi:hypothetical protein
MYLPSINLLNTSKDDLYGLVSSLIFGPWTHPEEADELIVADSPVGLELRGGAGGATPIAVALVTATVVLAALVPHLEAALPGTARTLHNARSKDSAGRGTGRYFRGGHRVPTPSPLSSTCSKAGRNHLKEEIIPPPPHWDRRAMWSNHIKFSTCSALVPM